MILRMILDNGGGVCSGTATVNGNPWSLFCDTLQVVDEKRTRSVMVRFAKDAGYTETAIDVDAQEISKLLSEEKTTDFITVKQAITELLVAAKCSSVDGDVISRADKAITQLFGD